MSFFYWLAREPEYLAAWRGILEAIAVSLVAIVVMRLLDNRGRFIRFSDGRKYKIKSVTSPTSITLADAPIFPAHKCNYCGQPTEKWSYYVKGRSALSPYIYFCPEHARLALEECTPKPRVVVPVKYLWRDQEITAEEYYRLKRVENDLLWHPDDEKIHGDDADKALWGKDW